MHKFLLTCIGFFFSTCILAQAPIFNSLPTASHIIFLDFDGHTVAGTSWNTSYNAGNPIVCAPSAFSSADIETIFKVVAEDYIPFNINITTDSNVFNSAPSFQKVRVVITPTIAWYGGSVGGVANVSSFSSPTNNVCFVFENNVSNDAYFAAEASSHEAGHTLGLNHHSSWSNTCTMINQYYSGTGSGEISWAPIMGIAYNRNQTTWSNLPANSSCASAQSDLALITSSNNHGVAFKTDDHANTTSLATNLNFVANSASDSGIIHTNTDVDIFKISLASSKKLFIKADPYSVDVNNKKANLDVQISVLDSSGIVLAQSTNTLTLNALIDSLLVPSGTYYLQINGTPNENNNGYGSIGRYYLTITQDSINNSTLSANYIATRTTICPTQSTYFSDQSIGNITSWTWTFTGGTPSTFNGQIPGLVTYTSPGLYNVSLTVSDGISSSTKTAAYIQVANNPSVYVSPPNSNSCGSVSKLLVASGGLTYNWAPATGLSNTFLDKAYASVSAPITYTVTGTDVNGCTASFSPTINAFPSAVLLKFPAGNGTEIMCLADSASFAVSGATTYTWTPAVGINNPNADSIKVKFPSIGNKYISVMGTDVNGCTANASFNILVRKCDSLAAEIQATRTGICVGDTINYSDFSTGYPVAWNWSFVGANTTASTAKNPSNIIYTTAGTYPVTLTITDSLNNTATRTYNNLIGVGAFPTVTISPKNSTVCIGDSLNLIPSNAQVYIWDIDSTLSYGSGGAVKVKPTSNRTYFVTGRNNAIGGYLPSYSSGPVGGNSGFKACTARDSSTVFAVVCAPLPLASIKLNGEIHSKSISIQWSVLDNSFFNFFEIEKSNDGINFYSVRKNIFTADNTYEDNFSIANHEVGSTIYFRIKGKANTEYLYSNTISIDVAPNQDAQLWPNPATDIINLSLNSAKENGVYKIEIVNTLGQVIYEKQSLLHPGFNQISLPVAELPKGIYTLFTITNNTKVGKIFSKQ
jgi:PKD repeat protein